jgi:hypothetical protein
VFRDSKIFWHDRTSSRISTGRKNSARMCAILSATPIFCSPHLFCSPPAVLDSGIRRRKARNPTASTPATSTVIVSTSQWAPPSANSQTWDVAAVRYMCRNTGCSGMWRRASRLKLKEVGCICPQPVRATCDKIPQLLLQCNVCLCMCASPGIEKRRGRMHRYRCDSQFRYHTYIHLGRRASRSFATGCFLC